MKPPWRRTHRAKPSRIGGARERRRRRNVARLAAIANGNAIPADLQDLERQYLAVRREEQPGG